MKPLPVWLFKNESLAGLVSKVILPFGVISKMKLPQVNPPCGVVSQMKASLGGNGFKRETLLGVILKVKPSVMLNTKRRWFRDNRLGVSGYKSTSLSDFVVASFTYLHRRILQYDLYMKFQRTYAVLLCSRRY